MATTNLNIKIDQPIKEQTGKILNESGLTMTIAIQLFLLSTILNNRIPFDLKIEEPNKITKAAIEEGKKLPI